MGVIYHSCCALCGRILKKDSDMGRLCWMVKMYLGSNGYKKGVIKILRRMSPAEIKREFPRMWDEYLERLWDWARELDKIGVDLITKVRYRVKTIFKYLRPIVHVDKVIKYKLGQPAEEYRQKRVEWKEILVEGRPAIEYNEENVSLGDKLKEALGRRFG